LLVLFDLTVKILPFKALSDFKKKPYSLHILDRNSNLLRILPLANGDKREYRRIEKIPDLIKYIFITSEDKRFYYHYGFDIFAIARSFYLNFIYKKNISGASTITMQLARIINPHKPSINGKIIELIDAVRLESKLTKKEILELWFNSIPFGSQAIGIESASKIYFGISTDELSPAQVLALSIIPRRPILYNTINNSKNLIEAANKLKKNIKYKITEEDLINGIKNIKKFNWPYKACHFVNFVENNLSEDLFAKGLPVKTSLDIELTEFIEEKIKINLVSYKESRLNNASALVIDNNTGEILAYVGSQNFFDKNKGGEIDGVHILNQPGSAIKPFLYGYAVEKGFYPNAILPDIQMDFGKEAIYIPYNFNLRFNGPVRFRIALASSLNVPSVYLITRVGVSNFIEKLLELEFNSVKSQKENLGSGIALGNLSVSLYEMVRAFSVFPRGGKKNNLTFIKSESREFIDDINIFEDYTAGIICDILSDSQSRAPGFGMAKNFITPFPSMFKTGTSNQFNNIWAFGAAPDFTAGVWFGNFSGDTVIGKTGSSIPAFIVKQILMRIVKDSKNFKLPDNLKKVIICPLSGCLTNDSCPGAVYEYLPKDVKLQICDYHYFENNKLKVKYPPMYAIWAKSHGHETNINFINSDYNYPKIIRPNDQTVFYYDPTILDNEQIIKIEVIHNKRENLNLFINGSLYKTLNYPYTFNLPLKKGKWIIEVTDKINSDSISITVN